ncbi:MAG: hypothetical protein IPI41_00150 [Flavobacteriales bacterium]|nr:hypothetical protein [Flavobacteriales bacterium]
MRTSLLLCSLFALASIALGQVHQATYDAWKTITFPAGTAPVQHLPLDPYVQRGGGTCDCWITPDASYTTIDNNSQWDASGFHNADDAVMAPSCFRSSSTSTGASTT